MARVLKYSTVSRKAAAGFSLVEILVALCVLGIVLLPFLGFMSYRISKEHTLEEKIRALEIARVKVEETMLVPFARDREEIIEEKYIVMIKVYDGDQFDEPDTLVLTEIRVSVYSKQDNRLLAELSAIR